MQYEGLDANMNKLCKCNILEIPGLLVDLYFSSTGCSYLILLMCIQEVVDCGCTILDYLLKHIDNTLH